MAASEVAASSCAAALYSIAVWGAVPPEAANSPLRSAAGTASRATAAAAARGTPTFLATRSRGAALVFSCWARAAAIFCRVAAFQSSLGATLSMAL